MDCRVSEPPTIAESPYQINVARKAPFLQSAQGELPEEGVERLSGRERDLRSDQHYRSFAAVVANI